MARITPFLQRRLKWLILLTFVLGTAYLLLHSGSVSAHNKKSPLGRVSLNTVGTGRKLNHIKGTKENFYITYDGYKYRTKPEVHVDVKYNENQPATYYLAGELARRYGARYIIDVGCGGANKLSKYTNEFHLIGIDYKVNVQKARQSYPHMTFVEADLDKGANCEVHISKDILAQAVVISADVIEHIVDPFYCYVKILQEFAEHAAAVLISTPDRERMAKVVPGMFGKNVQGPPANGRHVREWTVEELEFLFMDNDLHPILGAWMCHTFGHCTKGFTPDDNPYMNQMVIMANSQVRKSWMESDLANGVVVSAFVIIQPNTKESLLEYNVEYLVGQNMEVYVITLDNSVKVPKRKLVHHLETDSIDKVPSLINSVVRQDTFKLGDWFIVMDAHDVLTLTRNPEISVSVRDALLHIGQEPYNFNSVAMSYFFMQQESGENHGGGIPFKIYAPGSWDNGKLDKLWPQVDTLQNRVRIWRKTNYPVEFFMSDTPNGGKVITDVNFIGRKVYPFHILSLRFHPSFSGTPFTTLEERLQRMYALESALGYMPSSRKALLLTKFIY